MPQPRVVVPEVAATPSPIPPPPPSGKPRAEDEPAVSSEETSNSNDQGLDYLNLSDDDWEEFLRWYRSEPAEWQELYDQLDQRRKRSDRHGK